MVNTVGSKGRPGEHVRCIVSINMLSEGWDVKSVTHILGLRAFGSPLLTEQIIGRAFGIPFVGFPVEKRKRPRTGEWGQKPIWVEAEEKQIEISLGDGVSVVGRIDLVRRIDTDEITIVDLKSSDRAQAEDVTETQLHVYALG
jgi:hypothetical protein